MAIDTRRTFIADFLASADTAFVPFARFLYRSARVVEFLLHACRDIIGLHGLLASARVRGRHNYLTLRTAARSDDDIAALTPSCF